MAYNTNNPPYQQHQQQQHGFPAQQNSFQQSGFPFQPAQLDPRTVFTPQQPAVSSSGQPIGNDPFNNLAASMIQQQGSNYLERGQEFVKSRMGFINSSSLHYHFNVDAEYVRNKLLMLLVPFLKRWTYTRTREQIAGGHPFKPPRQDVNAPDLYIPLMALCTYCILGSIAMISKARWTTDSMYALVSSGLSAWTAHLLVLKLVLWLLGVPSAVPFLEALCYTGYPLVSVCINTVVVTLLGGWSYYAAWIYGSLCMATFIVRTMKRVLFREARQYSVDSSKHNYMLLGLAVFQFPYIAWLTVRP
ncbi:hypothetical protein WJX79_000938 [Trebouxia sp. C0005]|nr:MAG: integral membrane HRF1 family [Trebouxia sp. A1-2]